MVIGNYKTFITIKISFKVLKKCVNEYGTKIQKALLIEMLNPLLNKQLYAIGASFLLSIFWDILVRIILQFLP